MVSQMQRFAETLSRPDAVSPSRSNAEVMLYYRRYLDLGGRNRYICIVVERGRQSSLILTAFLDRRIKGEQA